MSLRILRASWVTLVGPKPNSKHPYKQSQTRGKSADLKPQAVRTEQLQAEEGWWPSEAQAHRAPTLLEASGGNPIPHWAFQN